MNAMQLTSTQVRHLQWYVRGVLVFGIITSITANVIHSLTQPHDAAWQTWSSAGLAALAPIVLFLTSEMVVRIPIHMAETFDKALGWIRLAITFMIAGFSGWVSYWHMKEVSVMLGERGGAEYFYPLIIDGMMIVATISLVALARVIVTVRSVEVKAENEAAQVRRCKPGCTCGRHKPRKAGARRTRTVRAPKQTPATPEVTTEQVSA